MKSVYVISNLRLRLRLLQFSHVPLEKSPGLVELELRLLHQPVTVIGEVLDPDEGCGRLFRLEGDKDGSGKVPGIFLPVLEHALPHSLAPFKLAKEVGQLFLGSVLDRKQRD